MQKKLRKYQDILRTAGTGVIAFGIWGAIKLILTCLLVPGSWQEITDVSMPRPAAIAVAIVTVGTFICADIGIRLLIGLSARSESAGGKKKNLYIAATILMMLISAASIVFVIVLPDEASFIEKAASLIFEGSSLFGMLCLVIAVFKVRSLTKKTA